MIEILWFEVSFLNWKMGEALKMVRFTLLLLIVIVETANRNQIECLRFFKALVQIIICNFKIRITVIINGTQILDSIYLVVLLLGLVEIPGFL